MRSLADPSPTVALSSDELAFFARLGARIAQLRKQQGITQVQLAETLGVSQQTITAYEVGRRRIQVSTLPLIAQALGVTVEALVAEAPKPKKRGPAPKLQQQLERLQALPKAKQRLVIEVLDSLLAQSGR
ncbi:MAG: helix-turn-helix domain-containing protein [Lysobacterales bacterium]|jgi:transcriptional regulator with XRE-family HTH domain